MTNRRVRNAVRGLAVALALVALPAFALQKGQDERRAERKTQAEVAAKGPFPTIAESNPEVKQALDSHDFAGAKKLIGKDAVVQGTVATVYAPASNALVILNFDKNYKNALVAVIKAEEFAKFPVLETLKDKRILVKGKFVEYNGKPELSVTESNAIKVVKQSAK